jgi:hypothetical protein
LFRHVSPETTAILTAVHADALQELMAAEGTESLPLYKAIVSTEIARAILDAASTGERDPSKLKQAALSQAAWA